MSRRWRSTDARSFRDRKEAGIGLAEEVARRGFRSPVVLALPRGGVPVAAEVASRLDAPLDVLIVRKLGCPGRRELAVGAIAEGGVRLHNDRLITALGIPADVLDQIAEVERAEAERRARRYRGDRPAADVRGRTAIVVDDGLATGFTARAAIAALRARDPARVVLAVPVGPADTVEELRDHADDVICVRTPAPFMGVGQWYDDFTQVSDDEVARLLASGQRRSSADAPRDPSANRPHGVRIPVGATRLSGTLTIPPDPVGAVIFAHGSGSSQHSPRNVAVAEVLQTGGLATLLFDLLDEREAADRRNVFDIELLASRLGTATGWAEHHAGIGGLPTGYFGASTGAAAALVAAAQRPTIRAVVSRGGRPDLAAGHLARVTAPTLLIVGGDDTAVVPLNERALRQLGGAGRLEIVRGATHLFAEPGALEEVAQLARAWFLTHLPTTGRARSTPPARSGTAARPERDGG